MFDLLPFLLEQLQRPEFLHLFLQPFLIHGLLIGAVFVLVCLITKQRTALAFALLIVSLCAACAFPYISFREEATLSIQLAHPEHQRGEIESVILAFDKVSWIYYALSGIALLAAISVPMKNKIAPMLSILVIVWALYASGLALIGFHHREARIYHPNILEPGEAPKKATTPASSAPSETSTPAAP